MTRAGRAAAVAASLFAAACSGGGEKGAPATSASSSAAPVNATAASIGGGVVARVGAVPISSALVASVARAQSLDAKKALDLLVEEAIVAEAARTNGGFDAAKVKNETSAALARAVLARFDAMALAKGPITDEELLAAVGPLWPVLDRPETRRVVHALVKAGTADGAKLAASMRDAIVGIASPDAYLAAAKSFAGAPAGSIVAEGLPPITADGRIAVVGATTVDETFAHATFEIADVGGTSPIVETPFGWHVIRLVKIDPPYRAPHDVLVEKLEGEVLRKRLDGAFDALASSLRDAAHPQILASDDDLMAPRFDVGAAP